MLTWDAVTRQVGVRTLSLPAAHATVETWTQGFGFRRMAAEDLSRTRESFRLLVFPGTEVLYKLLLPGVELYLPPPKASKPAPPDEVLLKLARAPAPPEGIAFMLLRDLCQGMVLPSSNAQSACDEVQRLESGTKRQQKQYSCPGFEFPGQNIWCPPLLQ